MTAIDIVCLKILAVDISHIFRVNWEATDGKSMGEAFKRTIEAVGLRREGFDRVAICADSGPSFRKDIDPAYKAKREGAGPAYAEQLQRTIDRLVADGCTIFRAPVAADVAAIDRADPVYYEADDVIGALCSWAEGRGHSVRILSGDKDMMQLVRDPAPGQPTIEIQKPDDGTIVNETKVKEKLLGLGPLFVADWLALAGDGSDGFKPFPGPMGLGGKRKPGIGDTTAITLLKDVLAASPMGATGPCSLAVFDMLALDETEPLRESRIRCGSAIKAILKTHGVAAAHRGLALATIRRDLPLAFDVIETEPQVKQLHETPSYTEKPAPEIRAEPVPAPALAPARHEPVQGPSTALTRVDFDPLALQPGNIGELENMALCALNARCYTQFANVEQIMMCIAEARERGIPMGAALRNAYIVKNKLAWATQLMVGLVLKSALCLEFRITETTMTQATVAYHRKGDKPGTFTFTIEEARRAGWEKSGDRGDGKWITNPRSMLRWAAFRECARFVWPDIVAGMYSPDELRNGVVLDGELEEDAA